MQIKFDYNNMMTDAIGKFGVRESEFTKSAAKISAAFDEVIRNKGKGWQEWALLPFQEEAYLDEMISYCSGIAKKADSFVVLGIGGSALGPMAVLSALLHLHHNELPVTKRNAPKYYVEDNVDPERMAALLDVLDLKNAYFNVITKSGETSETLSQFLILYSALKKVLGDKASEHIIVTTTVGKGTLYDIAQKEGFRIFGVGPGVGGRFSVLSPVGLVPFAVMGLDIKAMLKGAAAASASAEIADIRKNPALLTAFLQYYEMSKNCKNVSVLMPYADSLKYMADFYCQIWAESLGKAVNNKGKQVYVGQTPAKALGVTDQHSQVQLYTEGPYDKVVTFLAVENFRTQQEITDDKDIDGLEFLKGHTMNELINAERKATEFALRKALRSNFTITLPAVTEETVGELLMYFMYQTAFAGAFLEVDTFNQPGVEEGKKATFALMGRKGYEQKMEEINAAAKQDKYII